jgi:hypothetical protein
MPIDLLSEHTYVGYLEPLPDPGVEAGHIALLRFGSGDTRRAYVKLYPPDSRGLINEILGYLLAEALGLCVPPRAAIAMIPPAAVPAPPSWLPPGQPAPAWCTQDLAAPSIKIAYRLDAASPLSAVVQELREADTTPAVVAFDDWLANVDRNLGNLLRLAKGRYCLIDHGRVLTGPNWRAEDLDPAGQYQNVLRTLLDAFVTDPDTDSAMGAASRRHGHALTVTRTELGHWCTLLLSEEDRGAAVDFLASRAAEEAILQRYHLLL